MNRTYSLIAFVVVLALSASASRALAQTRPPVQMVLDAAVSRNQSGLPPADGGPSRIGTTRLGEPTHTTAGSTFAHFFLQDPTTSTAWWHSHTIVDGSGGVHLTFYDSDDIYYAHCAANCGDPANWLELPLFAVADSLDEPTLGVDASGRPRLMWYAEYGGDDELLLCRVQCQLHGQRSQLDLGGRGQRGRLRLPA